MSGLSILLPLYNGERTIRATLESFLSQVTEDDELIVVDDGSMDRGPEIVQQFAVRHDGLKLLFSDHAGQSAATNRAAQAASRPVLHFTAQDIIAPPRFLKHVRLEYAELQLKHRHPLLLGQIQYPEHLLQDPFMYTLTRKTLYQFAYPYIPDAENVPGKFLYAPNFTLAASHFQQLGGFREDFPYGWQDTDLGLRFTTGGGRIFYRAELNVWHDHPVTFRRFSQRQETIGRDSVRFAAVHPEFMSLEQLKEKCLLEFHHAKTLVSQALRIIRIAEENPDLNLADFQLDVSDLDDRNQPLNVLESAYILVLKYRFSKGVHDQLQSQLGRGWLRQYREAVES